MNPSYENMLNSFVSTSIEQYTQTCFKGQEKCGLLTQVNYSEKCTFGGLQG